MAFRMPEKSAKSSDRQYYLFAIKIAGDFGATIAIPVVTFVFIGRWLDQIYDKWLLFTVISFILAALVSARIIYKKAKRYGSQYQALINKK